MIVVIELKVVGCVVTWVQTVTTMNV